MFLIHASLSADDNGAVALLAEDYYFATLWYGELQKQGVNNDRGIDAAFDGIDKIEEPIPC